MPFDERDLPVVLEAHFHGALGGLAAALLLDLSAELAPAQATVVTRGRSD